MDRLPGDFRFFYYETDRSPGGYGSASSMAMGGERYLRKQASSVKLTDEVQAPRKSRFRVMNRST